MSRPIEAKYCPQCGAMNARKAETCLHCGRLFQSDRSVTPTSTDLSAPLSEDELDRTQMFTLPPVVRISALDARDVPAASQGHPGRLREAFVETSRSPVLRAAVVLFVAAAALLGWVAALGVFHQ